MKKLDWTLPSARISIVCSLGVLLISLIVVSGWVFDLSILTSFGSAYIPMAQMTAICFLFFALGLLVQFFKINESIKRKISTSSILIVFIIVCALVMNWSSILNFKIEEMIFGLNSFIQNYPIGRMSVVTGVLFIIASYSFLSFLYKGERRLYTEISTYLALMITLFGFIFFLGYACRLPILYDGEIIPPAFPTVLSFLLLGVSLMAFVGKQSTVARYFLSNQIQQLLMLTFFPIFIFAFVIKELISHYFFTASENQLLLVSIFSLLLIVVTSYLIIYLSKKIGGKIVVAEALLRTQEEQYRILVDSIPNTAILLFDKEHRYIIAAGEEISKNGIDKLAVTGRTLKEVFPQELVDLFTPIYDRALAGNATEFEHVYRKFHYFQQVYPIRDKDGRIFAGMVVSYNITEIKKAEEKLMAEKEKFLVTLKSIGDGVITTDTSGRVTFLNNVAEELTGWSMSDAYGKPLQEVFNIIDEVSGNQCENPVSRVISSGLTIGLANHTALIARDGTIRSIADSGAPIRNRENVLIGVVLVFRDITEEKKKDEALQNNQRLESIGILAGGIAHDFNNLLGGLFGYLEIACAKAERGDYKEVSLYIQKSLRAFSRAKDLTEQLLTFSKGGMPKIALKNISKIISHSAQFTMSGSDIRLSMNISDSLWPCYVDENQFAQVIDNIVLNARQAMPYGGNLSINAQNVAAEDVLPQELDGKQKYVKVSISDTGHGISKEHINNIFDPFFTTKQRGSGLGLSTAYSIIKNHSGRIEVSSEVGIGTKFDIYIPANSEEIPSNEIIQEINQQQPIYRKVLIMDDEEDLCDICSQWLETFGCETYSVFTASEAIETFSHALAIGEPFALVILDLTVPGELGGVDVVRVLKSRDPSVTVVATSGYSDGEVMSKYSDYGFDDILPKPYSSHDLRLMITKNLLK